MQRPRRFRTNSNHIAAIEQSHLRQFYERVMLPVLADLRPQERPPFTGRRGERLEIARINGHNALCYEARRSFALMIGASFERQLRLWLCQADRHRVAAIQKADFNRLVELLKEIQIVDLAGMEVAADLQELRLVVNVARHGDGPSSRELVALNPELWDSMLRDTYAKGGLLGYTMRVQDADLRRYLDAVQVFWSRCGGSPFRPMAAP